MNQIILDGIVGYEVTAQAIREQLPADNTEPIELVVSSPGGSVFEGFDIFNLIKSYPGEVTATISGIAASAASYFIAAADKRKIYENSTIMIHRAWNLAIGNAVDMKKTADILDGIDGILAKEYAKLTGKTKRQMLNAMTEELWMIGSDAIMDNGFADELVYPENPDDEPEALSKGEVMAQMEQAKEKLRSDAAEEQRAAAMIKAWAQEPAAEPTAEPEPKDEITVSNGVENKNEKEDSTMTLNEFLEKNPDAKAEVEASKAEAVKTAFEKGYSDACAQAAEILEVSGAKLSETAMNSIKEGKDFSAYAEAEVRNRKPAQDNAPTGSVQSNPAPDAEAVDEQAAWEEKIKALNGGKK